MTSATRKPINNPTAKETNPTLKDVSPTDVKDAPMTDVNVSNTVTSADVPATADDIVNAGIDSDISTPVKPRISPVLADNAILADFAQKFIDSLDEIASYNKDVLSSKDSEWNPGKLLAEARKLGQPDDANVKAEPKIKSALDKYDVALTAFNKARKEVVSITAEHKGITLSATAERDPEVEATLKEKHKFAVAIGTQLSTIAEMLTNAEISAAVTDFLASNPLPAIGRDQTRSFGKDEKATPKYRVTVIVKDADGKEVANEKGFTKAGFALTKFYERGKALKSEDLRNAWEKAGNTPEVTKTNPVEFTDNNLHFTITKNA